MTSVRSTTTTRVTQSNTKEKKPIWTPLLERASKTSPTPEKHLLLLGGTPDQQREFLETHLNPQDQSALDVLREGINGGGRREKGNGRDGLKKEMPPLGNRYAMGYTYYDVLESDYAGNNGLVMGNEDVLARVNVWLLGKECCGAAFVDIIRGVVDKPGRVKEGGLMVVILLDWSEVWRWARQLRQWVRVMREVVRGCGDEVKIEMEDVMSMWKAGTADSAVSRSQGDVPRTIEQGEWDEELGLPMCCVCINVENQEKLEREQHWDDSHFDFVCQWLRTVLLKHGAGLCYVAGYDGNGIKGLLQMCLGIRSLLRKEVVKNNVIDRDKIFVSPNWDGWGKIRILGESFEPEAVSAQWSVEIQPKPEKVLDHDAKELDKQSAITLFEAELPPPPEYLFRKDEEPKIETVVQTLQEFLKEQQQTLARLAEEDETNKKNNPDALNIRSRNPEYVPHQVNVNGIDVDAEEATRRLREREVERNAAAEAKSTGGKKKEELSDMKDFFANMMAKTGKSKSGTASGVGSPRGMRVGSPRPTASRNDTGGGNENG